MNAIAIVLVHATHRRVLQPRCVRRGKKPTRVGARGLLRRPRPPRTDRCGLGTGLTARRTVLVAGVWLPMQPKRAGFWRGDRQAGCRHSDGHAVSDQGTATYRAGYRATTGEGVSRGHSNKLSGCCHSPTRDRPPCFPYPGCHTRNVFTELHLVLAWVAESLLCRPLTLSQPAARVVRGCDVSIRLPSLQYGGLY